MSKFCSQLNGSPQFLPHNKRNNNFCRSATGIVSNFIPVRSHQCNGMAEALVLTFKLDYVFCNDRPDTRIMMAQLPGWFEDYNENVPPRHFGCFHLMNLSVHYKTWCIQFGGGNSTTILRNQPILAAYFLLLLPCRPNLP